MVCLFSIAATGGLARALQLIPYCSCGHRVWKDQEGDLDAQVR